MPDHGPGVTPTASSIGRRTLFASVVIVVGYLLLEAAAFVMISARDGQMFSFRRMRALQLEAADPVGPTMRQTGAGFEAVHPYVGYVIDPHGESVRARNYRADIARCCGVGVNEFGFLDDKEPFQPARPDRVVVGLTGGSVAFWMSVQAADVLIAELQQVPKLRGREIVLVRLAAGGYKQPQQLQILTFLLALGAHFDLLINLDGFNEVALPPVENIPQGVFPFYPRHWFAPTNAMPDRDRLTAIARQSFVEERRAATARWMLNSPARFSVFGNTLWRYYDRRLGAEVAQEQAVLRQTAPSDTTYVTRGPRWIPASDAELYTRIAAVWRDSSLQMHHLARGNGAQYVHVLQPNQYVPGSKPLSPEERRSAWRESQPYRIGVEAGYGDLIRAGAELRSAGVAFVDLTQMFGDVSDTLYVDDCCHLNEDGNRRLARAIGRAVAQLADW